VKLLCLIFDVSTSGYYHWCQTQSSPGPRALANIELTVTIRKTFAEHRQNYGSPRVSREVGAGRNRVAKLMRENKLAAIHHRRHVPCTTDSNHTSPIAPNLLPAKEITGPNQAWTTDMTYLRVGERWVYLAGVLDLYSRRLVGWSLGETMETSLVLSALSQAVRTRQPGRGLLHHSDQGSQYASHAYRQSLTVLGYIVSMSRRGNCYDNATMESFWATLKRELIDRQEWKTVEEVRNALFLYIEGYYNRRRRHSSLSYQSPLDFESQSN
jgi:transposase InsO family protein